MRTPQWSEPPRLSREGGYKESRDPRPTRGETPLHPGFRAVVLTAGEDQRAGVLVHGEVVQLQLALCINGEPAEEPRSLSRSARQNLAKSHDYSCGGETGVGVGGRQQA